MGGERRKMKVRGGKQHFQIHVEALSGGGQGTEARGRGRAEAQEAQEAARCRRAGERGKQGRPGLNADSRAPN